MRAAWKYGSAIAACVLCAWAAPAWAQRLPASNPVKNLPQVEAPARSPSVDISVAPARTRQLRRLLSHSLIVHRFDVAGVHALAFKQVAALFEPLHGKRVRVAELLAVAKRCSSLYKAVGYALSFCYIPAQDFAEGVVRVVVVEGYVARLEVAGKPGRMAMPVRDIAGHVLGQRPLRSETFQRYVRLLGQLPGTTVKARVPAPRTTDGATTMKLDVKHKPVQANVGVDFNHPGVQGIFSLSENGLLTPWGEQLKLSTLFPSGRDHAHYLAAAYRQGLGSRGWQLDLGASRYRGTPDDDDLLPDGLERQVHQDRLSGSLRYPLRLDPTHTWYVSGGMYAENQSDRYANRDTGASLALDADTRVVELGTRWQRAGEDAQTLLVLELARGLDAWGASARVRTSLAGSYRQDIDIDFSRLDLDLVHTRRWHRYGIVGRLSAQYSADTLPSAERINFGGQRFGLGYDPGVSAGNSGYGASVEFNRVFQVGGAWLDTLTPYLLYQYAQIDADGGGLRTLGSAALGLRLADRRHYRVDLALARPVGDASSRNRGRHARVDLTFAYQLP